MQGILQSEPANLSLVSIKQKPRGQGQIWVDNLKAHLGGPGEPSKALPGGSGGALGGRHLR